LDGEATSECAGGIDDAAPAALLYAGLFCADAIKRQTTTG
jgi:hypothetical protein